MFFRIIQTRDLSFKNVILKFCFLFSEKKYDYFQIEVNNIIETRNLLLKKEISSAFSRYKIYFVLIFALYSHSQSRRFIEVNSNPYKSIGENDVTYLRTSYIFSHNTYHSIILVSNLKISGNKD